MQVQSENGSVIISNIAAKHVSTNAQNPGPSGSAVIEKRILLKFDNIHIYNGLSYLSYNIQIWHQGTKFLDEL